MSLSLKCAECGTDAADTPRLVAFSKRLFLCMACIDIAHEVAHEHEGTVKIGTAELEVLRRNSFIGANAAHWVQLVRRAVNEADMCLAGPEAIRDHLSNQGTKTP